jgi:dTDP-L-rhamnose 4-epimerase
VHLDRERPSRLEPGVRFVLFDVTSAEAWEALLGRGTPDVVVHLAAETGTAQSLHEATLHASSNVLGTTQMLDAFSRVGHAPAHLVLASSRAVYGEGMWTSARGVDYDPGIRSRDVLEAGRWDPVAPDGSVGSPLPSRAGSTRERPTSVYGATKLAQEHLGLAWGAAHGVPVSVLRLQNVYGPGQAVHNSYSGVLTTFARRAVEGKSMDVYEDGAILRDFVHVDDVLDAVQAAVLEGPVVSRTVDVGSGRPVPLLEVARSIAELAGSPRPLVSGKYRPGDVRAAFCSIEDAREQLGFVPRRGLAEGLEDLLRWVREAAG